MKKVIAWILTAVLLLSLCACGGQTAQPDETKGQNDSQAEQSGNEQSGSEQNKEDNAPQTLTVDAVQSAPETKVDEFDYDVTDDGVEITSYNGDGGIVVVPEKIEGVDVVLIGEDAFVNNRTVTAVRLPDSVSEVDDQAFTNCSSMEIFIAGKGLKRLGKYSFNACAKLSKAILGESIEVIDDMCFSLTALTEVELPNTVKKINYAFEGKSADEPFIMIGEAGSFVEQYVQENGESLKLTFRAK